MSGGPLAHVGDVVVTCPGCGASLPVLVEVASVQVYRTSVEIAFRQGSAEHGCGGRS